MIKTFLTMLIASQLYGLQLRAQTGGATTALAHPEMQKMAFTLGKWRFDGKYPKPDGTFGSLTYRSNVNLTMGGKAYQDNFCEIKADDKLDTVGITMRTFDAANGKWRMLWLSSSLDFITQFEGEFIDGEFHFNGKGVEKGRPFLEKVVFYNISENSYSWKMDRSYDDGKTWIEKFFSYDAIRIK